MKGTFTIHKIFALIVSLSIMLSCSVYKKVNSGKMAYDLKQYAVAVDLFTEEYQKSKQDVDKARIAYYLGKSYQKLNDSSSALKWYNTASGLNYGDEANVALAYTFKRIEQYENARLTFKQLYEKTGNEKYSKEIKICNEAADWKSKYQNHFVITSLSANSEHSDYSPAYFENKFLVFSSDRITSTGDYVYEWTGNDYSDLFIMNTAGNSVFQFEGSFNTSDNEGAACFNQNHNEIYFTRCISISEKDDHCRIYFSNREDGNWTEPRPLLFFDETVNYGHPTLMENDSVLIFSVLTDKALGYHDLFYSVRLENGWSSPEAMPDYLNTSGDEVFPTSHNDTLYFSSNGHPGMGGLDVFKSYLRKDNSWSRPNNMKYPINSGEDDFGLIIDPTIELNGKNLKGFMTSSRSGQDDIFKVVQKEKILTAEEELVINKETPKETDVTYEFILNAKVLEIFREGDDPNGNIERKKPMPNAQLVLIDGAGNEMILNLNKDAKVISTIKANQNYKLIAKRKGYLNDIYSFKTGSITDKSQTINASLELEKIYYNVEIDLDNIYYDFDKWDIRDDAKPTLDSLVTILKNNEEINVQLGSHTDCQGPQDYNQELSQKRAESAIAYITLQNIANSRLSAKGYGESNLSVDCNCDDCSDEEHQINRRTTFKIVE